MARRKKLPPVNKLAKVLLAVAQAGEAVESTAVAVITLTRGIPDLKAFDKAVREAYALNGWNTKSGRPAAGARKGAVPPTVKQYVSLVRSAFRLELPLASYQTFHALRKALKKAREKTAAKDRKPVKPDANTDGVYLRKGDALTGATFHDLVVLYDKLGNGKKMALAQEVERLVKRFQPGVQLVLAPVEPLRKAA